MVCQVTLRPVISRDKYGRIAPCRETGRTGGGHLHASSEQRLARFVAAGNQRLLGGGLKGLEKESLRVSADGWIAQTPHPIGLGSALTNPCITTDFSEALLEFITPPCADIKDTMRCLHDIHRFVYAKLDDELLWATSMPCRVGDDDSIPIAHYGSSNVGTMKRVYRQGLRHRYGSVMQTIAGIHFNYSFPDNFWPAWRDTEEDDRPIEVVKSDGYFRLIRNFQRFGWLIPFLFGTSPAICKSFLSGRTVEGFNEFDNGTWFQPHATSLRMSDIGYKNKSQSSMNVSYANLASYVETLTGAIETSYPEFQRLGVHRNGEYIQLNANLLQIENEYYSFVRPKQVAESGEKPTLALKRRGVRYVEIRALDVGAFEPAGVSEGQLRFVEAFLGMCLFQEDTPLGKREQEQIEVNQQSVACCGRDPALELILGDVSKPVSEWAKVLCEAMRPFCELLDTGESGSPYTEALECQLEVAREPELMPSARLLAEMRASRESFFDYAMRKSTEHEEYFQAIPLPETDHLEMEASAERSLIEQQQLEAADEVSFEQYLEHYFAQR